VNVKKYYHVVISALINRIRQCSTLLVGRHYRK